MEILEWRGRPRGLADEGPAIQSPSRKEGKEEMVRKRGHAEETVPVVELKESSDMLGVTGNDMGAENESEVTGEMGDSGDVVENVSLDRIQRRDAAWRVFQWVEFVFRTEMKDFSSGLCRERVAAAEK